MRKTQYMFALIAMLLCTATLFPAEWTTFRGNMQRTGYYSGKAGYPTGDPIWEKNLGATIISSPVVAGGILYVGSRDSTIRALDAATGDLLWSYRTGGWVDATPFVDNGKLVVSSRDGKLYMLDAVTGSVILTKNAGLQLSSPALTKSGIVVSGLGPPYNGYAGYDLDAPISEPRWRIDLPQMSYSSPCVYGQMAVIGANDGRLYGFNSVNGDTVWTLRTAGGVYMSTPATDGKYAYFAPGNYDRYVYCVDILTGEIIWKNGYLIPATTSLAKKAANSGMKLIAPHQFIQLLRYSPQHRKVLTARLSQNGVYVPRIINQPSGLAKSLGGAGDSWYPYGGMKTSSVAIDKVNVYAIQKELGYPTPRFSIFAFDKNTGEYLWSKTEERTSEKLGYCSSPIVTRSAVFFGWGEGMLYALDPSSGKEIWADTLDGTIVSSPAIADEKLFVATMSGSVYAYSLSKTAPGLDFKRSTYCYPNPARGDVSHIQVYVEQRADVDLVVYNVADKPIFRVSKTVDPTVDKPDSEMGKWTYHWNLTDVANGVYLARIKVTYKASGKTERRTVKIAVLR